MKLNERLSQLAAEIRQNLANADQADQFRIIAGRKLIEARRRVEAGEAGEVSWSAWVKQHVQRSLGDIRKIMALARAPDAAEALKKERARARAGMAKARAKNERANVRAPPPADADDGALMRDVADLITACRLRLVAIKDHGKRSRALALIDKVLADVRADMEKRRQWGDVKPGKRKAA